MSEKPSRRAFLKGCLAAGAILGLPLPLGATYTTQIEPRWIEVVRMKVKLAGLSASLDGFTIAQLSDLHLGPYVRVEQTRKAVALTNGLSPDLIVLTGDYVYGSADYSKACAQELAALKAPYGVYAVLGNHDHWIDADIVTDNLREVGITVLDNDHQPIQVGEARLWLIGIDTRGITASGGWISSLSRSDLRALWQKEYDSLQAILEALPAKEKRILLAHNPDFVETMPLEPIDLILSGHTHGGQVRLPILGTPLLPSAYGQKYAQGLVRSDRTPIYVNRGIGLIPPPVRFLCRPEVTLIRLLRKPEGSHA